MSLRNLFALGLVALCLSAGLATAQVPSPSYTNIPLTNPPSNTPVANVVITNTARAASTVTSNIISNLASRGVICTYNQTAHAGGSGPSTTIEIDAYDAASVSFQQWVVSGAITADNTPTSIVIAPGVQTSSLPTGMVALNMHAPNFFRVKETVAGTSTPTVTGTVGCTLLN